MSVLSKSVASASSLVFLQLLSRLATFSLNQALVRLASPQVYGTATIQFELLHSTILFLSREGVRNALLRAPEGQSHPKGHEKFSSHDKANNRPEGASLALIHNISLLPMLLGIPFAVLATSIYLAFTPTSTSHQPHFGLSITLYTVAAVLELISEPFHIRAQNQLRFSVRVRAEGTAVVVRSVVTLLALICTNSQWSLAAFAAGQTAYAMTVLLTYVLTALKEGDFIRLFPRKVIQQVHGNAYTSYFDAKLLHLSSTMTAQSLVKQFLTEGDKFMVSRISPLQDQGGYAVASNYGSLVARIVFQPIEETSRLFFSKTLASVPNASQSTEVTESLRTASSVLSALLLFQFHLALLLLAFAHPYLSTLLEIVLPARYFHTSAPKVIASYAYYLPVMSFNGVLEAFLASIASPDDLKTQSRFMIVFSIIFIISARFFVVTLGLGEVGLVWANTVNLASRAVYSARFIDSWYSARGVPFNWRLCIPPKTVLAIFAIAGVLTRFSQEWFNHTLWIGKLQHIAVGCVCLVGCFAFCFISERETFDRMAFMRRRTKT